MANLPIADPLVTDILGDVLLLRQVTLGDVQYRAISDSGIDITVLDPLNPGGTGSQAIYAVGNLWPRGDGTPSGT